MPDTMIPATETAAPPSGAGIPVEISRAIGEVMAQIKSLPKTENNDHSGYRFASIDAFLAFTGPLCASVGLIVLQDEDGIDLIERAGKTWVKMTYSFTLAHVSGILWDRPIRRTVFQRVDGPQTTGGTQSYSLKMFLRSLFAIPTGDQDDPDFHEKHDMGARQEAQERSKTSKRPTSPKTPQATQRLSDEPDDGLPVYTPIPIGSAGALYGRWTKLALAILAGRPESFRRDWLEMHAVELAEMRAYHPEWCDKVEALAIAPDLPAQETAA